MGTKPAGMVKQTKRSRHNDEHVKKTTIREFKLFSSLTQSNTLFCIAKQRTINFTSDVIYGVLSVLGHAPILLGPGSSRCPSLASTGTSQGSIGELLPPTSQ